MCQIFAAHWGYAKNDFNFKSLSEIITDLCICRRHGANFLINVGPMSDGSIRSLDKAMLETLGEWVALNDEALRNPRPTNIEIEGKPNNFILTDGKNYYLFCHDMQMGGDANVVDGIPTDNSAYVHKFTFDKEIESVNWLDNGAPLTLEQNGNNVRISTIPFRYGEHYVVRVAKISVK